MRPAWLVLALLALIRLPLLNQAIQGDDFYYLAGARHAQIDPLHPHHARYAFLGQEIDMRGHPHPPGNSWFLALLLAVFRDIEEVRYHAVFCGFSLLAAWSAWSLARRFSPRPLWPVLFTLATPAFIVNGGSLEADVPFLAFWLSGFAAFIRAVDSRSARWLFAAAAALALAALYAYQAVAALPVLAFYLWLHARSWRPGWAVVLTPVVIVGAYQALEQMQSGELPAAVLAGHFRAYGLQTLSSKLRNAAALSAHLAWVVGPVLALAAFLRPLRKAAVLAMAAAVAAAYHDPHPLFWASAFIGVLLTVSLARRCFASGDLGERFLCFWFLAFMAFALAVFFAGSARYLLPVALPMAVLATSRLLNRPRLLAAALLLQLALGGGLAWANYDHWDGYRLFVASLRGEFAARRVWINGEWGLRYYAEAEGGLPILRGQPVQPGEAVVSSRLAFPIPFTTGGGVLAPLVARDIRTRSPFRLIALNSPSAWSTASRGLRPFDIGFEPIDAVFAQSVLRREPALEFLPMNAPEADNQIVSGFYQVEGGGWRWMAARGTVLLKSPAAPARLQAEFHVPEQSPVREVSLRLDDAVVANLRVPGPGSYSISSRTLRPSSTVVTAALVAGKSFRVPGDHRELSVIVASIGFRR